MPPKPKQNALNAIFGNGDEDSDLSDLEDNDIPEPRNLDGGMAADEDGGAGNDEEEDAEAAAEDEAAEAAALAREQAQEEAEDANDVDYTQQEKGDVNRLPSFKKDPNAPATAAGSGQGKKKRQQAGDDEGRPKKRAKKKTRDLDDLDMAPPMPLDPTAERAARLDAILSQKKKKAPRKRKAGEEDLDEMADEEVYRLRQSMDQAAETDKEAVEDGRPAIEKLKLLPEVVSVLQKPHLEGTILEADVLTQIRRWLEPIGKAMPALNIQRALLEALGKMDIETSQLKASELGKVVLFYTKHPKLDTQIKRLADQLVMAWMRPIIRRSAAARDRAIVRAEADSMPRPSKASRNKLAAVSGPGAGGQSRDKTEIAKRHAAIPEAISTAYTIAPISRITPDQSSMPRKNERFKGMKSRLDASKADARRM